MAKVIVLDEKKNSPVYDLEECVRKLESVNYKTAQQYITLFCEEEKKLLIKAFKDDFKDVPADAPIKMETLHFLGKLGIIIKDF
jgi:DNA modification methylase